MTTATTATDARRRPANLPAQPRLSVRFGVAATVGTTGRRLRTGLAGPSRNWGRSRTASDVPSGTTVVGRRGPATRLRAGRGAVWRGALWSRVVVRAGASAPLPLRR